MVLGSVKLNTVIYALNVFLSHILDFHQTLKLSDFLSFLFILLSNLHNALYDLVK